MKIFLLVACFVAVAYAQKAEEQYGPPEPYQYAYKTDDAEGSSSHEQSTDGTGRVQGKYTIDLADGRSRTVTYWADETGFHADIITNELGTESKNPADVTIQSSAPTGAEAAHAAEPARLAGLKGKSSYLAPTYVAAPQQYVAAPFVAAATNQYAHYRPVHSRY